MEVIQVGHVALLLNMSSLATTHAHEAISRTMFVEFLGCTCLYIILCCCDCKFTQARRTRQRKGGGAGAPVAVEMKVGHASC